MCTLPQDSKHSPSSQSPPQTTHSFHLQQDCPIWGIHQTHTSFEIDRPAGPIHQIQIHAIDVEIAASDHTRFEALSDALFNSQTRSNRFELIPQRKTCVSGGFINFIIIEAHCHRSNASTSHPLRHGSTRYSHGDQYHYQEIFFSLYNSLFQFSNRKFNPDCRSQREFLLASDPRWHKSGLCQCPGL